MAADSERNPEDWADWVLDTDQLWLARARFQQAKLTSTDPQALHQVLWPLLWAGDLAGHRQLLFPTGTDPG